MDQSENMVFGASPCFSFLSLKRGALGFFGYRWISSICNKKKKVN